MKWYGYGALFYDHQLGRFTGIDPISEKFYHVTTYNYAENSPISNIDLWGLQKVFFQKALDNDNNYKQVYNINKQTSGGKRFNEALKQQSKYNVFYYSYDKADYISGKHNVFENKQDYENYNDPYRTFIDISDAEIEAAFEDNTKGIIAIGLEKVDNTDIQDINKKAEKVSTLNHEEVAHGMEVLLNGEKTKNNEDGHAFYYGEGKSTSPTTKEVLNNEKYDGTIAKDQAVEIIKLLNDDETK